MAVLAAVCLAAGCGDPVTGDALPDVEIEPLTGGAPISLGEVDGPAVVNLWATWCAPCRREIPAFEAVHLARGDTVQFVGINVGETSQQAAEFIAEVGATYDQYLDPKGFVSTGLEATTMPVTVVIDDAGRIVVRHLGEMRQDELEGAIDRALES